MTLPVDPRDVERFRAAVARGIGLGFDDAKTRLLEEVLLRRASEGRQTVASYLARLEANAPGELAALARDLTVGETYFFRNREQFRALAEVVLPERVRANGALRAVRMLSAGCASGEEAYSLAIVARETIDPAWEVSIAAVDVNPAAIERAVRGRFSRWSLRETSQEVERRWFRAEGRDLVLDEDLRRRVVFEQRNLVAADPRVWRERAYDVVFCRNVLMYMTPDAARGVVARLARALAPGGYLFLGHAETLRGLSDEFDLCHTHETFYYRARGGAPAEAPATPVEDVGLVSPLATGPATGGAGELPAWMEAIRQASERVRKITESAGLGLPARDAEEAEARDAERGTDGSTGGGP